MKTDWSHLERYRKTTGELRSEVGNDFGAFIISRGKVMLIVMASPGVDDVPWEHVSVHAHDWKGKRTPTWEEMCAVKNLFWDDEECVMQLHPPRSDYVNNFPFCLHLWKPTEATIPRPPSIAVGIRDTPKKAP